MRVWIVYEDSNSVNDAVFSSAEKAFNYMKEKIEDAIHIAANDMSRPDIKRDYEYMLEDIIKEYNENSEDFGCDECWTKSVEVDYYSS